ncbi:MAG: SDR family NAD(P)-dependent oxidoreductase [Gammaproteobacteria bacterium]|nr:SDR family NAD(P)-dependent oxidoreductase [Gammaproteobacteria bacterium]
MRLKNKIAIITGGSQGIGEAVCYAYAQEGATVIVVNKNNP